MRYVYDCPLRWSDLDAFGHVNNARFLTIYEEARVALMFTRAREEGVTSFEEGIVIARHEIDYLRPVDYASGPDGAPRSPVVRVEMWVDQIRPSRFSVAYELFDVGVVASRGRSVCVPYDVSASRPRRLSGAEEAYLREWTDGAPTESGLVEADSVATGSVEVA